MAIRKSSTYSRALAPRDGAVWEQNPKDGKMRRWVLVQVPEKPDVSEESGKNALAAGYKTIFEVTAKSAFRRAAPSLQQRHLIQRSWVFGFSARVRQTLLSKSRS